ncbi:cell wall hydrolase [Anaerocolumna sp. AGMB13020]|uniref:cell wall hydrolase n=1 Tax=Anaerocolumna sp. AGMB13020 TaxID=3081750 RepID=UPI0029558B75|nr:cell wall hydrolase [Anaerocolumna sp. AGMB13020]WOO35370.1 cell wall hydrolase [Anaerocolumna sp. AGMB13020]
MKFRKLLLCMLAGIFLAGFANIYTYAAEEDQNIATTADTTKETAEVPSTEADTDKTTVTENTETEVSKQEDTAKDTTAEVATVTEDKEAQSDKTTETEKKTTKTTEKAAVKKSTTKAATKTTAKTTTKTTAKKTAEKKVTVNYSKSELRLLSTLIYCEAGGESYNGKLAVGIVVMNRVRASAFPDSVKSVIYQKYQFGPVTNGALNKALSEYDAGKFTSSREKECIKAAKEALSGVKSITVSGKSKSFGSYLFFSGRLSGSTYKLGNHQFK